MSKGAKIPRKSRGTGSEKKAQSVLNSPNGSNYPAPLEVLGDFDEEQGLNFFEPISYKKLVRVIGQRHPIDPETKQ